MCKHQEEIPFHFPYMPSGIQSHWCTEEPTFEFLTAPADPAGFWEAIQDSEYESTEEIDFPPALEEMEEE